jgi:transmembrane sensor
MKSNDLDVWRALERLRNRPVVAESRDYARRWSRSYARSQSARRIVFGRPGAVAALCMAVALLAVIPVSVSPPRNDLIETGSLEMRTDVLPDGSTVMLNTNSRLRVDFKPESRDIELLEGEAHFEVAKNPQRPFRVRAGAAEIVAVGTVFDVSERATKTTVTLIEGRVDVHSIADTGTDGPVIDTLSPAQQLAVAGDGRILGKTVAQVANVTAWQHGTVNLDDIPLAEALDQVNRYSAGKITVADPSLAGMRISGVFRIGDTEAFVAALERYFGLKANWRPDRSVTLERP